jgi:hypothetical protein
MKKIISAIILLLISRFVLAQGAGFEPPVIIDPPNPMIGDTIRVGLFKTHYYPCLILPQQNLDGETHMFDFGNCSGLINSDTFLAYIILKTEVR